MLYYSTSWSNYRKAVFSSLSLFLYFSLPRVEATFPVLPLFVSLLSNGQLSHRMSCTAAHINGRESDIDGSLKYVKLALTFLRFLEAIFRD